MEYIAALKGFKGKKVILLWFLLLCLIPIQANAGSAGSSIQSVFSCTNQDNEEGGVLLS